jgi:hypothetical protein
MSPLAFPNGIRPDESGLPPLPKALPGGNFPARQYLRASIARDIIKGRRRAGLSQAELARRAGIQPAVLNRIERASAGQGIGSNTVRPGDCNNGH